MSKTSSALPPNPVAADTQTQNLVRDAIRLPSLPGTVQRINSLLASPDVELADVVATLAKDPALAAKTLSIASGSYYGVGPVSSIAQAVVVLGIRELHGIVLQASVIQEYEHLMDLPDVDLRALWKHAILTGQLSQEIGTQLKHRITITPEECYSCGLLHDIGILALLDSTRDAWLETYRGAAERKLPIWLVEQETLGFSHLDVGGMIASSWGFADAIAEAIEGHHGPNSLYVKHPETAVVAFADRIADCVEEGDVPSVELACSMPSARALGIGEGLVESLIESAERNWPTIRV